MEKKKEEGWTFVFLGADQDAWLTGQMMGVHAGASMAYRGDGPGTRKAMVSAAAATVSYAAAPASVRGFRQDDYFETGGKGVDMRDDPQPAAAPTQDTGKVSF